MFDLTSDRRYFLRTSGLLSASVAFHEPKSAAGKSSKRGLGGVLLYSGWATKNIGDFGHTRGIHYFLPQHSVKG
jgi:hypothetical protein